MAELFLVDLQKGGDMDNFSSVAISSRIRLARNISGVEFMPKLNDEGKIYYISSSMQALLSASGNFTTQALADLPLSRCTSLLERHIISKALIENKDISLVSTNEDETIIVMIMEEDHLRLQSILPGLNLFEAYNNLLPLDEKISSSFIIAFDEELGYLTSSPSNLGTGMRASIMVFLPALEMSGKIGALISDARKEGLTFRGVYGEGSEGKGFLYQISNQGLLGLSEEQIIDRVNDFFINIYKEEISLRASIYEQNKDELTDRIMRAYGTLTNAYLLEEDEMFSLLGMVRFGHELGILKISDVELFMKLYYHAGGSLLKEIRPFSQDEKENRIRAEYIVKRVKNLVKIGGKK